MGLEAPCYQLHPATDIEQAAFNSTGVNRASTLTIGPVLSLGFGKNSQRGNNVRVGLVKPARGDLAALECRGSFPSGATGVGKKGGAVPASDP
jgi:hypothetical protein